MITHSPPLGSGCVLRRRHREQFLVCFFFFPEDLGEIRSSLTFSHFQVRLANTKTNKSSTIYGTDSYVVSLTTK